MTPRPARLIAALALTLAAAPAGATDPWGVADDRWEYAKFENADGQDTQVLFFAPHYDEVADGKEVPLYRLQNVSSYMDGTKKVYVDDMIPVAYTATANKGGDKVTLTITLKGTSFSRKFSWADRSKAHEIYTSPQAKEEAAAPKKKDTVICNVNCHKPNERDPFGDYKGGFLKNIDVVATPGRAYDRDWQIKANSPKDRDKAPVTFFPENSSPMQGGAAGKLEALAENAAGADKVLHRFLPYEVAFNNPALAADLKAVTKEEIGKDPDGVLSAARFEGPTPVDEWAKKRRVDILTQAKALYDQINEGHTQRPDHFNKLEGELLWTIMARAGVKASFVTLVKLALAGDEAARKTFVKDYRNLLLTELTNYRDHAKKLAKLKGTIETEYNTSVDNLAMNVGWTLMGEPQVVSKPVKDTPGQGGKGSSQGGKGSGTKKPKPVDDAVISDMFK